MRVIVAGSRNFTDRDLLYLMLQEAVGPTYTTYGPRHTIVQGFARGADRMAYDWGKAYGCRVQTFYPDWQQHGKAAGYIRNRAMVESEPKADLCLIFYGPNGETAGTKNTEELARNAGIPVRVYFEES